jgi:hypothetical protein
MCRINPFGDWEWQPSYLAYLRFTGFMSPFATFRK